MTFRRSGWLALAAPLVLVACGNSTDLDSRASKAAVDGASFDCKGYPRTNTNGTVTVCEEREYADLPTRGKVNISESYAEYSTGSTPIVSISPGGGGLPESGIRTAGEDRSTVTLTAYIYATGSNEGQARATASAVEIHTDNDSFYATGPSRDIGVVETPLNPSMSWVVSFDARLPTDIDLNVSSLFGPVIARDLAGTLTFAAENGDLDLARLSGSVTGSSSVSAIYAEALDGDVALSSTTGRIEAVGLAGTILLDTSGGPITATDLDGDSRLTTSTGTVILSRARGSVTADVSAGQLQAEDLDGDISFDGSSANVKLGRVSGYLKGQTGSGSIELDLSGPEWSGDGAEISTSSGNVTLWAPADYSAVFDFTTVSGTIRSDFTGNSFSGQAHYSETVGHGGARLSVSTSSGDIALVKK